MISGLGTWGFRHSDGNAPVSVAESEGDGRVVRRFEGGRERERNMLAWKCHGVLELL